jgi:hypothetical protein
MALECAKMGAILTYLTFVFGECGTKNALLTPPPL